MRVCMATDHLAYREHLTHWLKGDQTAVHFIEVLFAALHVWDDITDKDRTLNLSTFHQMMEAVLIELPRNRFYITNFAQLNSVLHLAIVNWHIANAMERSEDELNQQIAFILRSTYVDLVTSCALIIGGTDWAIHVGKEARRHSSSEGFPKYIESLAKERRTAFVQEVSNG
jgi:hypothetical protein